MNGPVRLKKKEFENARPCPSYVFTKSKKGFFRV